MDISGFTFLTGRELDDGRLIFGMQTPDMDPQTQPHTGIVIMEPDGTLAQGGMYRRATVAIDLNENRDGIVLTDAGGTVSDYRPGKPGKAQMYEPESLEAHTIRCLHTIGGQVFASGMNAFVHRRVADGVWQEFSDEAMRVGDTIIGVEAMAGFSPDEIYTFGWEGQIWSCLQGVWSEVASPTNTILSQAVAGSDRVFAAGQMATIVEGRGNDWRVVEHDLTTDAIWGAATFGEDVYFSTSSAILKWSEGEMSVDRELGPDLRTINNLFVGPRGLWCVGTHDVAVFDGDTWTSVLQS